ncbi:hypothetical protein ACJJTC_016903 [Scirpophaga incertulas]
MRSKLIIGLVLISCILVTWLFSYIYLGLLNAYEQSGRLMEIEYSWFFRLLLNIGGYLTVLLPGFILYKYVEKSNYFDNASSKSVLYRTLYACFGEPDRLPETVKPTKLVDETSAKEGYELIFCFTGLMGAYLVWGLLQEKIMTQNYSMPDGTLIKFNDSQFLVFINRLLAFVIALTRLLYTKQAVVSAPLYKFSYCSVTNIISAWCQYEALKYVSFPTQVLSKSCKVIPVMLMGKLISRNKYEVYEYVTAVMISVGMMLFMFGSNEDNAVSRVTTASGAALLALYMACDSFTSSWQGALFATHGCSPLQMLCAVNLFSCALTAAALAHQPASAHSLALLQDPTFAFDCLLLSASSAFGQLLIYRTISSFGAVVFTIIMTLRQALSILLSCLVYGHVVTASGGVGVVTVFLALLLRVYCRQRLRRRRAVHA